ncbi:hypothetical protein NP493_583g01036 [Ridgeia piscesae]|uniref:Uncharacterized protein n=1 Tax=Ridgeia piscesae TaxID=27915 RepID=A0AAD9KUH6_RIDPI|nr:hypothetical protein NP493_583g01036 [Ridgeia piscesae]
MGHGTGPRPKKATALTRGRARCLAEPLHTAAGPGCLRPLRASLIGGQLTHLARGDSRPSERRERATASGRRHCYNDRCRSRCAPHSPR